MADSVISFVVERVGDLLIEEAKFLYGVEDQVLDLHTELLRMQCFLEDADSVQEKNRRISNWIGEIRELAYKAENVLETFIVRVSSRRRRGLKHTLKRFACILSEGVAIHQVGSEIESIKSKITNLTARLQTYGVRDLTSREGLTSVSERRQLLRRTYSHIQEEDFVGFEEDIDVLAQHLVNEEQGRRVVSICGIGGQGKTTLGRKMYHHGDVRRHFEAFAWACISQQWTKEDVLKGILISFVPEKRDTFLKMRDAELVKELFEIQETKKCLVVLDDVWSSDVWEIIKPAFPSGKKMRSKILLTTRIKDVPTEIDPLAYVHELRQLDLDESWELFTKKAFPTGHDPIIDAKQELGREMVKHCQGLPLAIVVLGGLLATKHSLNEWQMVKRNFPSRTRGREGQGGVLEVLALSYSELPYRLKPCFLYLANFPSDFEIEAEKLYQLWIAEGIISTLESDETRDDETMMDVAESYLGELVQRCMVQVQLEEDYAVNSGNRRFKSCRLHDLMQDLCLSKAKEENFITIFDLRGAKKIVRSDKMHRLAIFMDKEMAEELPLQQDNIRSVILFYSGYSGSWQFWRKFKSQLSGSLKMARVLDLQGISYVINELPSGVGRLTHLRYLSIRNTRFIALPSSIGKLRYLQTLDLRKQGELNIPNVLWKMENLKNLYLPLHFTTDCGKLRLDGLKNLEMLENFDAEKCSVKDLLTLTNLRKLVSASVWHSQDDLTCVINYLGSITSNQRPLKYVYIAIRSFEFSSSNDRDLLGKLLLSEHLNVLEVNGTIQNLPVQISPSLTELWLAGSVLKEDPMKILEKLPNLRKLGLIDNAYVGNKMVCSSMGFPDLRYLVLGEMRKLVDWRVDEGTMPRLSTLKLQACNLLEMIPDGIRFIYGLKELKIWSMPEAFKDRVRVVKGKEGDDFFKVRHVTSIDLDPYVES